MTQQQFERFWKRRYQHHCLTGLGSQERGSQPPGVCSCTQKSKPTGRNLSTVWQGCPLRRTKGVTAWYSAPPGSGTVSAWHTRPSLVLPLLERKGKVEEKEWNYSTKVAAAFAKAFLLRMFFGHWSLRTYWKINPHVDSGATVPPELTYFPPSFVVFKQYTERI